MKLTRIHIIRADACGRLLDGLVLSLRDAADVADRFDPFCLVGMNGSGKSQLLQVIAEMFQCALHACAPDQERTRGNEALLFEAEYLIRPVPSSVSVRVRISRTQEGRRRPVLKIERMSDDAWVECDLVDSATRMLLPRLVVGYTSGDNETLSLPFLVSRSGYAREVRTQAFASVPGADAQRIPDTRLMLIDYGTHLEVLVANLLLGAAEQRAFLLNEARLKELYSFRCVIQLAHSAISRLPLAAGRVRKGVQLTDELEKYIENLRSCSTCHSYDEKTETYVFDFWVNESTRLAFGHFWKGAFDLYSALHKLSMLNDLAIPNAARDRLLRDIKTRRFASRLPEPQDEDRVFRFEQVSFVPRTGVGVVDYVSLSDGEHQLAQILGTMCMASFANVLFLLDEPESHFNPQWRVKFISRLLEVPTSEGNRASSSSPCSEQDCLITTHAPFVPSDMPKERVLIFRKDESAVKVRWPDSETYGATYDSILQACFEVRPPLSELAHREINDLMKSNDVEAVRDGVGRLGDSVQKIYLMDHLRSITRQRSG